MMTKINFSYLKKLFHDQKYILIFLFGFVFLFELSWVWILFKSDLSSFINNYANMLPQSITNMIGFQAGSGMLSTQMMSFGYAHPLILISMCFLPVSLPARYISGEIENRTFDIVLTKPVSRWVIPVQLYLFLLICLALLCTGLYFGTWLGTIIFNIQLHMFTYLKISVTGYLFFLSLAAISMSVSSFNQEKGKAQARMIAIVVVLYFFDVIIRAIPDLDYLTAYSYFQLYQPTQLTLGNAGFLSSSIISLCIAVTIFIIALIKFNRRDL
jgi:ABC-type transport system involved in multi-copper enzyme maturation permease subunit